MSDSQEQPWSDNPNAPKIPYRIYFDEKANFAGHLLTSILYGIVIVLFFKCIAALFNPVHRRGEPIKWGLVSYVIVMFSLGTIQTAIRLHILSISYIDDRKFHGFEGEIPPGPVAYQWLVYSQPIGAPPAVLLTLSNWLADGLLLYRCYIVYSMNLWVIAFPCIILLGSIAMGIAYDYQNSLQGTTTAWAGLPYFTISLSLNILLTLMISVRLIMHARSIRTAVGIAGIGRLCNAIVTMLIESCVIYAVSSLLVIGPWAADSPITNVFLAILPETQVIAPLLIIQRVANKSALTSDTVMSGRDITFKARSLGESTGSSSPVPSNHPVSSGDGGGENFGEVGIETATDFDRDKISGSSK